MLINVCATLEGAPQCAGVPRVPCLRVPCLRVSQGLCLGAPEELEAEAAEVRSMVKTAPITAKPVLL